MSFQALSLVSHLKKSDLSELEQSGFKTIHKCTLMAMANYADEHFNLFPSYQTLADEICCSKRTIINAIKHLVEMKLLTKITRKGEKGNSTNIYKLNIIAWLQSHSYSVAYNDKGFLQASKLEGCKSDTPLVQNLHPPGEESAPDPITDPINEPEVYNPLNFEFEKLWKEWPNRNGKKQAEKAFKALIAKNKDKEIGFMVNSLIQDVQARLQANQFGFVNLYCSTYLNNERWLDDMNPGQPARKDPLLEAMGLV